MTELYLLPAFNNDPVVQRQALSRISEMRAQGDAQVGMSDPDRLAREYALAPAYLHLVSMLDNKPYTRSGPSFANVALSAMAPGTPTLAWVVSWFCWVYFESGAALSKALAGTSAAAVSEQILALHWQLVQGQTVHPEQWRNARSEIRRLRCSGEATGYVLDVVSAMAWDLTKFPGAAGDVLIALEKKCVHDFDTRFGWTADTEAELMRLHAENVERAADNLRIKFSDVPNVDMKAYTTEIERLWDACGSKSLLLRGQERGSALGNVMTDWYVQTKQQFLTFHSSPYLTHILSGLSNASNADTCCGELQ